MKQIKISSKIKNPAKYIELNPTIENSLKESTNKLAVFTFGRFNPPTIGHELLIEKIKSIAKKEYGIPLIFLSHSNDDNRNPLSYQDKYRFMKIAFGSMVMNSNSKTIIDVLKELNLKYERIIMIVGSDRVTEFSQLLNKYNGREYSFKDINIISAGMRDPDSDLISSMSSSKMRQLVLQDDFDEFVEGLPIRLKPVSKEVYSAVKKGLNMNEEIIYEGEDVIEGGILSLSQRRRRGMTMRRYASKIKMARERAKRRRAPPEKLKLRAQRKALGIIRQRLMKSKKYSEMSAPEKIALDKRLARIPKSVIDRIARKQLPIVRQAETQRLSDLHKVKTENINEMFEQTFQTSFVSDVYDLMESTEKFIEQTAVERVRAAIASERESDKRKHQTMMDRAKQMDKIANSQVRNRRVSESIDKTKPSNREYGTDSLDQILRNDTPGQYIRKLIKSKMNEGTDTCPILTAAHLKAFEQFANKLFQKYGIDFEFTKHFRERMSHERNDPCIDMKELAAMIQKIYKKYQHGEKSLNKFVDSEAVIKDLQSNLNMPVAIEYDRKQDELVVIAKTIMRKKNFSTPNPIVKV